MERVESNPNAPVVVLAGSTLRAAPLDQLADELRRRGATVEVVAGVDRRRVDLLKLSFRYRAQAAYLLFGGPELREDSLNSITVELEANGVPKGRISGAMMRWDAVENLGRQAIDRLASMGVDIEDAGPALPRPTLLPTPPPAPAPLPTPTASALPRPAPVPLPTPATSALPRPAPPSSRPVPRRAWVAGGVIAIAAVAVVSLAITSGDAAADENEVRDASVAGSVFDFVGSADEDGADRSRPVSGSPEPLREEAVQVVDEAPELNADAPTPTGDDAALVYAALRNQSIRALDILLVSPPASRQRGRQTIATKMNFESAREHCQNLEVDGVIGWRLPDIGEAQWLSKSNLIRTGIYWTATKADAFGSERVVWNPRSQRMRSSTQRWRGGRVVCVRYQNGDDPGPR